MKSINKIVCASLAMASFLALAVSCGNTSSSAASTSGSSTSEKTSQSGGSSTPSSATIADKDATVASVDITIAPKSEYAPGEVFDITGLMVDVNLSNGHKVSYMDGDFSSWTHKDEPLTEDITNIVFSIPDREFAFFNFPITVAYADDVDEVTYDLTKFDKFWTTDAYNRKTKIRAYESINFTFISVKVKMTGDTEYTDIKDGWTLWEGEKEYTNLEFVYFETVGTHSLTIKYHNKVSAPFDVVVEENTDR